MPSFRGSLNDFDQFPFGKHRGVLLMDVPEGYFRWLSRQAWLHEWPALERYVQDRGWGDEDDGYEDQFDDDFRPDRSPFDE